MKMRTDICERILELARSRRRFVATAESCTGGMVAAALTDIAGSSDMFERGFVTYSNAAKMELLGVAAATLSRFGAVSSETAAEMAGGALERSSASVAVSVTGVAGPGGGTAAKSVGLVWFGLAVRGGTIVTHERRFEDLGRAHVRAQSVDFALSLILEGLQAEAA